MAQNALPDPYSESRPVRGTAATSSCRHCGQPVPLARQTPSAAPQFCCSGCEAVYGLLNECGLSRYYAIREHAVALRAGQPAGTAVGDRFEYLDEPEVRAELGIRDEDPQIDCFLEGVHCTACVWLVERLPSLEPGVREARLDLGRATVRLRLKPGAKFAPACEMLAKIGYTPHPLFRDDATADLERKENRRNLLRLAVAGAVAGNVMLFSIGLYAGADGALGTLFRWLSVAVAFPAFAWSALPFYRSAWGGLRARALSIDFPIALALIGGYLASVAAALRGSNGLYLDSLTGLIFLLLSTRYVLRRLQRTRLDASGLFRLLAPVKATRLGSDGTRQAVSVEKLRAGDAIEVGPGEIFPADGSVEQGTSQVDSSVLTGESDAQDVSPASPVFAGTRNLHAPLTVRLSTDARGSRLGQITDAISRAPRQAPRSVHTADRAARLFVAVTLGLALGIILYKLGSDPAEGLRRALCLVVVACPCALALATPLSLSRAYRAAAASGILLKYPEVLDDVADVRDVFVDKTGTLTRGTPVVQTWDWLVAQSARDEIRSAVYSIESRSAHPIATALVDSLGNQAGVHLIAVEGHQEMPGLGVSGRAAGHDIRIARLPDCPSDGATWLGVWADGNLAARVALRDELRAETPEILRRIRRHWTVTILSGDGRAAVSALADRLALSPDDTRAEVSPEEKARIVARQPNSLMIGDGANDALALARARVGVAVQGSLEVSIRAADVVLLRSGLAPLLRLLTIARETRRVLHRNYAFSIAYNALGAYLALKGTIGPLFAAVVMPASAMTVFLSSAIGTRRLRGDT